MSPFWGSLFDALRGRGRNATLFVAAVLVFLGLLLLGAWVPRAVYVDYVLPALPWIVLMLLAGGARHYLLARRRKRQRIAAGELSRDELQKARSKLVKGQNRKLI
jgi:hypothetical protein